MGVFVASFAGTTLDTSVRIQRYVISEITSDLKLKALSNRWVATTIAVVTGALLAFATGADGKGAMKLWPLFGSVNQLLAALALLVISMYLKKKGGMKYLLTALPCAAILTMTSWALILQLAAKETGFFAQKNWLLAGIGTTVLLLAMWMVIETVIVFAKNSSEKKEAISQ